MSGDEYSDYISDRLFSKVKPVIFTDLINNFKCGPNKAKSEMYAYYKNTKNVKFQCVIVACFSNDTIKIINDLNNIDDQDKMTDCFIYAFNPMDVFNPVNDTIVNYEDLMIQNPNKIKIIGNKGETVVVPVRAKTLDKNTTNDKPVSDTAKRSSTVPAKSNTSNIEKKNEPKKKEGKLRPTELLAKRRKERQEKEANRQEELKKRKEEQEQQRLKNDPKTAAQMQDLNDIFGDGDLDDYESEEPSKKTDNSNIVSESSPQKLRTDNTKTTINASDLEEILDTTGEESLLMLSQNQTDSKKKQGKKETEEEEEVSTYMDEDGYMVTKKTTKNPVPPKSETKRKLQLSSSNESTTKKAKAAPARKKQGSLDFFFKKK
ncbi:hypothetical protein C6P45_000885 [Maudiozyma exigua]|uniref:DNA polymerase delta subunit 3 n=1 Tax=Maudiozyma exigua TaxID=34358 RepID=A0A9P6W5H8_MAUEX|nr:hypothetical protein C6P45_000885 [Kazachstania exigua]